MIKFKEEKIMMEVINLNEMEMDIDTMRDLQEYGYTCTCPYSFYAAVEYGCTEN